MNAIKLEATQMIPIRKSAFHKDAATHLMRHLIKDPKTIGEALSQTSLRFSLMSEDVQSVRLG